MVTKEMVYKRIEDSNLLPQLSGPTQRLMLLLNLPGSVDIEALTRCVEEDVVLSEQIISYLNSDCFNLRRKITNIKGAIVYLGIESFKNFIIFFITQKFFRTIDMKKSVVFNLEQYWNHVLATSIAADMISEKLGIYDRYKMFFYGLNHDIGILVMNICLPEELDVITKKVMGGVHQIIAERSVLGGITHSEIGAWLCQRWNFSSDISQIVQYHHTPYLSTENTKMIKIMYLADIIGTDYYERLLNVNNNIIINRRILKELELTVDDQRQIGEQLSHKVTAMSKRFTF